jgi:hypothetical protein
VITVLLKRESNLKQQVTVQASPSFLSLLTLAFVVLKLTGFISWSWWLVFLPVLIPVIIIIAVLIIAGILALL